ncbi:hypothetical protein AALB81_03280 [Lachnospiraceae bacterium 48-33]
MADFIKLGASGNLDMHMEYMLVAVSSTHVVLALWENNLGPTFTVRKLDINYRGEKYFYYNGKRYYLPEDSVFPCVVPSSLIL